MLLFLNYYTNSYYKDAQKIIKVGMADKNFKILIETLLKQFQPLKKHAHHIKISGEG
jgi:hypothetical protein